ncbi:hypothetical protein ATG_03450 [Desulfurococcaceae archaeon AG1]|nr:hypothetical protein ATG_03450 [Desulfurococcaceae archaeon AG1]
MIERAEGQDPGKGIKVLGIENTGIREETGIMAGIIEDTNTRIVERIETRGLEEPIEE